MVSPLSGQSRLASVKVELSPTTYVIVREYMHKEAGARVWLRDDGDGVALGGWLSRRDL
jgi:hypothetical protein